MKNEKGFALLEVLIVAISTAGLLLFIYMQFQTVDNNFDKSLKYNNINSLYKLNIARELVGRGISKYDNELKKQVDASKNYLLFYNNADANSCLVDETRVSDCLFIFNKLGIKTAIYANKNLELLVKDVKDIDISEKLKGFIKFIEYKSDESDHYARLIVEFKDGTFGTLLLGGVA